MDYVTDQATPDPMYMYRLSHAEADIASLQAKVEDLPAIRAGLGHLEQRLTRLTTALWTTAGSLLVLAATVGLTLR